MNLRPEIRNRLLRVQGQRRVAPAGPADNFEDDFDLPPLPGLGAPSSLTGLPAGRLNTPSAPHPADEDVFGVGM